MPTTVFPLAIAPVIHHGQNATADALRSAQCVYGTSITMTPGNPPEMIFVGVGKLVDVFALKEARANSEWSRITNNGQIPVMITLLAIADTIPEASAAGMRYMNDLPQWPHCNRHGYNLQQRTRRILASNGTIFETQQEAARIIGISESAISQHLHGKLKSVKGLRLTYLNPDGSIPC